jgi:dGTPase
MTLSSHTAPYATLPEHTKGRVVREEECHTRTPFQRDRDRIIHSAAFRRLEYKTQVFVNHEGDHYRTRLTHSLEVAQITRSLCRALGLNEDLGEAVALAHDLGHPPFGHAGEDGLKIAMQDYGGFDHNAQALHIVTKLEQRYAAFDGLNLSWETLEGLVKHNGPLLHDNAAPLPEIIAEYQSVQDLHLSGYAGAEAQIAALADDIAYNNHDVEDGVRAGMFALDELRDITLFAEIIDEVDALYAGLDMQRRVHEVLRRAINRMVSDVYAQMQRNVADAGIASAEDVRSLGKSLVHFSDRMQQENLKLKAFLKRRMYRHWRVNRMSSRARRVVQDLHGFFLAEPECLPNEWGHYAVNASIQVRARLITNFIAGMTDRFALAEHRRIFDVWDA